MTRRLASLLIVLLLILQCAIAHAAPPALTVSVVQRDAHADLLIGSFDTPPTTLAVTLPTGWSGPSTSSGGAAPWTVVVSGTEVMEFALVRGADAPQLGMVQVSGGGMQGHAYLAGATIESAPPRRAGRALLAMVRR